jgi:hypothetical protein
MAQLTIYLDDEILEKVKRGAQMEGASVSKWVRRRLEEDFEEEWPAGYFDLLGKLDSTDFKRPSQPPFDKDIKRESV